MSWADDSQPVPFLIRSHVLMMAARERNNDEDDESHDRPYNHRQIANRAVACTLRRNADDQNKLTALTVPRITTVVSAAKSHLGHVAASANAAASDAAAAVAAAKAAQAAANSVGCALNTFSDENYGIPSPYRPPPGSTCP